MLLLKDEMLIELILLRERRCKTYKYLQTLYKCTGRVGSDRVDSDRVDTRRVDACIPTNIPTATSGLRFFLPATLQHWESQIKANVKLNEIHDIGPEERVAFEVDDFDLDLGDGVLLPILSTAGSVPNLADRRSQVGDNPTGTTLTLLVNEDIPLNQKQQLVVEKVLSRALAWGRHKAHCSSTMAQQQSQLRA
jgi:hypothetical protein